MATAELDLGDIVRLRYTGPSRTVVPAETPTGTVTTSIECPPPLADGFNTSLTVVPYPHPRQMAGVETGQTSLAAVRLSV